MPPNPETWEQDELDFYTSDFSEYKLNSLHYPLLVYTFRDHFLESHVCLLPSVYGSKVRQHRHGVKGCITPSVQEAEAGGLPVLVWITGGSRGLAKVVGLGGQYPYPLTLFFFQWARGERSRKPRWLLTRGGEKLALK